MDLLHSIKQEKEGKRKETVLEIRLQFLQLSKKTRPHLNRKKKKNRLRPKTFKGIILELQ